MEITSEIGKWALSLDRENHIFSRGGRGTEIMFFWVKIYGLTPHRGSFDPPPVPSSRHSAIRSQAPVKNELARPEISMPPGQTKTCSRSGQGRRRRGLKTLPDYSCSLCPRGKGRTEEGKKYHWKTYTHLHWHPGT